MVYEQIKELFTDDISRFRDMIDLKTIPIAESTVIYRLRRNDGTPVAIVGLIRPFSLALEHVVWLIPMRDLRPFDFRGMKKLLAILREYCPYLYATADEADQKGIRLLRACDFQPQERYGNLRVYKWL